MLAQSFCKIPQIPLEEEWHRRLIDDPWHSPPACAPVPQLAAIDDTAGSQHALKISPTGMCQKGKLSFIYMNESEGNWSTIAVPDEGVPLPSESGVLHCAAAGCGAARDGGCSNLVMRFAARPDVRRASLRAEAAYRRWRRGLPETFCQCSTPTQACTRAGPTVAESRRSAARC